jgi:hypothetical protein
MSYIHNSTVQEDKLTKSEVSFGDCLHFPRFLDLFTISN